MNIDLSNKINNLKNIHYDIIRRINSLTTIFNYSCILNCFLTLIDYELQIFGLIINKKRHYLVGIFIC